jgi:hypothetical protein
MLSNKCLQNWSASPVFTLERALDERLVKTGIMEKQREVADKTSELGNGLDERNSA